MKVFITGSTGYLGSEVTKKLIAENITVLALVRSLKDAPLTQSLGAEVLHSDLGSLKEDALTGVDVVIHCAFKLFPHADRETNVENSKKLIELARNSEVKKFIFISSSLVYGPTPKDEIVTEDYPLRPNLEFARHQVEVEQFLQTKVKEWNFPGVILRSSEIYGGSGGVFNSTVNLMKQRKLILGMGRDLKISFTKRSDLVAVIYKCLNSDLKPGEVFNINTPMLVPANELYEKIARKVGCRPPIKLPVSIILLFGWMMEILKKTTSVKMQDFDFDIAKLCKYKAGTRSIKKAVELLDFRPENSNPLEDILSEL